MERIECRRSRSLRSAVSAARRERTGVVGKRSARTSRIMIGVHPWIRPGRGTALLRGQRRASTGISGMVIPWARALRARLFLGSPVVCRGDRRAPQNRFWRVSENPRARVAEGFSGGRYLPDLSGKYRPARSQSAPVCTALSLTPVRGKLSVWKWLRCFSAFSLTAWEPGGRRFESYRPDRS